MDMHYLVWIGMDSDSWVYDIYHNPLPAYRKRNYLRRALAWANLLGRFGKPLADWFARVTCIGQWWRIMSVWVEPKDAAEE